jgi:hypothetical protein
MGKEANLIMLYRHHFFIQFFDQGFHLGKASHNLKGKFQFVSTKKEPTLLVKKNWIGSHLSKNIKCLHLCNLLDFVKKDLQNLNDCLFF